MSAVVERTKSGYYYPNKMGRIYLTALEEVMGKNGLNAILRMAKLDHFIDHYPPDNLAKEFDFSDIAALHTALEEMYGPRGGRGLCQRAGRALFSNGLRNFGALAGAGDLAFKVLPLGTKIRIAVPAIAKVFSTTTDQISNAVDQGDHFIYTIERCSMCWGRQADKPVCHTAVGIIQEAMKWMSGGKEFRVEMHECMAMGAPVGKLKVFKEPQA